MDGKVGACDVAKRRKSNERSRNWENRGFNQVSEERKGQVAPSGIGHDNDIARLKSDLGYEIIVPGNGVDQGGGERVGSGEGSGRGESVFKGEQAVHGFGLFQ